MDDNSRAKQIQHAVDQLLQFLTAEGGYGGTIGPDGLVLGLPDWEARTMHQRASERVKTHGYPLGFAKSQLHLRDSLLKDRQERIVALTNELQAEQIAVHEAMAWALDVERLLGSFNGDADGRFPISAIDRVASHILAWLDHRGFQVVTQPLDKMDTTSEADGVAGLGSTTVSPPISPAGPPAVLMNPDKRDEDDEVARAEEDEDDRIYHDSQGWLSFTEIDKRLGNNRVPCLDCGGEGQVDGLGPVSWSCNRCLGTGRMSVSAIEECLDTLSKGRYHPDVEFYYWWQSEDLSAVDFRGVPLAVGGFDDCNFSQANFANADLSGSKFFGCNFSHANFESAQLADARFEHCDFSQSDFTATCLWNTVFSACVLSESNPEQASDLDDAMFRSVTGLNERQLTQLADRGAIVES